MAFTAKDVQALRQATGAGMMDAKKALEANDGDIEAAKQWLREQGLAASAKRDDRENTQGVVALTVDDRVGAIVELKCETDFVAGSEHFKREAQELAHVVAAKGPDAVSTRQDRLEDLKITLKEKIELGRVVRVEAADGDVIDSYLHVQGGRGVNGVLVVLSGGDQQLAHDVAVHIAFARPKYLSRDDVPADVVEAERATLETITRNEGKPEQAIPKIVEGRLQGFFKTIALLDQPYAKDDKQTIRQLVGDANDRRVRPGRDRLKVTVARRPAARGGDASSSNRPARRWPDRPARASTAPRSTRPPTTSSTCARDSTSTSLSSSAAATSGAAGPGRWPGWTRRSPTTSACSAR